MSRDDSSLYTGMTSASFTTPTANKLKQQKEQKEQDRRQKKQEIQPIAEPVLDLIQKYKDMIADDKVDLNAPAEQVKTELMSSRKCAEFIRMFELDLKAVMREHNL